jgi:hypothetical protein
MTVPTACLHHGRDGPLVPAMTTHASENPKRTRSQTSQAGRRPLSFDSWGLWSVHQYSA